MTALVKMLKLLVYIQTVHIFSNLKYSDLHDFTTKTSWTKICHYGNVFRKIYKFLNVDLYCSQAVTPSNKGSKTVFGSAAEAGDGTMSSRRLMCHCSTTISISIGSYHS